MIFTRRRSGAKKQNLEKGRIGENLAKKYLQDKGYKIIGQNYRTPYSEIDIIAEDKGALVFVEVRSRQDERFGSPEGTINRDKINRIIWGAKGYLARNPSNKRYRIDAVCIVLGESEKPQRIDHYENVTLDL